jgi:hypothetical protein
MKVCGFTRIRRLPSIATWVVNAWNWHCHLGGQRLELDASKLDIERFSQPVNNHKADVMTGEAVFTPGITQTDEQVRCTANFPGKQT